MKNIMVDNWFMEEVVADINCNNARNSRSYADLLMAIVLWDEVYYPENAHNWWKSFPSQVQNVLHPIDDSKEEGFKQATELCYHYNIYSSYYDSYFYDYDSCRIKPNVVEGGALRYMMMSNNNGCDYLPCSKRQSFLLQYNDMQIVKRSLIRLKMQDDLDKSIKEYYTDTYRALLDFSDLKLEMPVLVNFIFDNTPNEMTPVDYAFHLKNEGAVINYRKYLSQVEDALENQNWRDLRFLLRCSSDAVSEITSLDKKNLKSIGIKILPMPSILLEYDGLNATISSEPSFEIKKKIQNPFRKIHLTFLKDLTRYAINDMKLW